MSPRCPFQSLQEQASSGSHVPRATTPDLVCYETMPSPGELAAAAASRSTTRRSTEEPARADDCWCLEQCAGARCRRARVLAPRRSTRKGKRKALRTPSPHRECCTNDDAWPQRVLLWHPGDFEATPVTVDADEPLGNVFRDFCEALRVERKHVRFLWQRVSRDGDNRPVNLRDADTVSGVGMREGRTEHVECEYR